MLTGASPKMMGKLRLDRDARVLELILTPRSRDLFGEVVITRFESLARSLDVTTRLTVE